MKTKFHDIEGWQLCQAFKQSQEEKDTRLTRLLDATEPIAAVAVILLIGVVIGYFWHWVQG